MVAKIVRDIYMVDENLGWAVGDQGLLLRTGNGGRAWSPVRSPTFSTLNAVAFTSDGQTGWIAANGGLVYKTEDGGAAWQPVTHENVQDPIYSWKDLAVYGDRERLVLVGENSSNGRAAFTWQNSNTSYRTLDVDGGPGLYGVSAKGRRIAAVGSNGLLVYTLIPLAGMRKQSLGRMSSLSKELPLTSRGRRLPSGRIRCSIRSSWVKIGFVPKTPERRSCSTLWIARAIRSGRAAKVVL